MSGYGLMVRFTLRPGHEDAFDALVARTLAGIRAEHVQRFLAERAEHLASSEVDVLDVGDGKG